MVERRRLTREFVRLTTPPARGERWIADTQLRGFGLRLSATPSGVGKAFGLRITDKKGRKIRKTFDSRNAWPRTGDRWKGISNYELSDSLEQARRWARDEIDIAKGRPTLEQDRQTRRQYIARRIRRLTLEEAVQKMTRGMCAEGLSQPYVDRLDRLFALHIPKKLWSSQLNKICPADLARALAAMAANGGNLRILKSFIGQLYDRASEFDSALHSFPAELSRQFWKEWQSVNKLPFPELQHLKRSDYEMIFDRLEAERERCHQALCIRLFFMFGAPLCRLMAAQWWQIVGDRWYPYLPEEKVYWFESSEPLDAHAHVVLGRVRKLAAKSRYWFPSPDDPSRPIATTQTLWRDILQRIGSRHYPLAEFARSYRPSNNPTYAMTVLRQYGPMLRSMSNAAKVSNELRKRKKKHELS